MKLAFENFILFFLFKSNCLVPLNYTLFTNIFHVVIFNVTMSEISHVDTIMFIYTMYSYVELILQFVA